jgi:hypothetical protein
MNVQDKHAEEQPAEWPLEKMAFVLSVQPSVLIALTEDPNEHTRLGFTVSEGRMYIAPEEMGRWLAQRAEWLDFHQHYPDDAHNPEQAARLAEATNVAG